jgi:hypothetical protein
MRYEILDMRLNESHLSFWIMNDGDFSIPHISHLISQISHLKFHVSDLISHVSHLQE